MSDNLKSLLSQAINGDYRSLARILSMVENDADGADELLLQLKIKPVPVIGITGPPGAGKSTLVNALAEKLSESSKIAILAVDPSSPFNKGSLLGDRIRMNKLYDKPGVFIRSLSARGSLGGLSGKTIEMTDVLKSADFDFIFIETVGVGQSEVEIAGLADVTVVVLVPESGDDIQHIKSGLMEIADVFVVNKADREGADIFTNKLKKFVLEKHENIKVIKTVAERAEGVEDLIGAINLNFDQKNDKMPYLMAEKAWTLMQHQLMKKYDKKKLLQKITEADHHLFNLYRFIEEFMNS